MRNWKQKLAWISVGMTLAFFIPVIWIGIVDGNPIGYANATLRSLLWDLYIPEVVYFLIISSMLTLVIRYYDLKFNLFGFNNKNCDTPENSE